MTYQLDCSSTSTVVTCGACGWRTLAGVGRLAAWQSARAHELRAHPGEKVALRGMNNATRRTTQ